MRISTSLFALFMLLFLYPDKMEIIAKPTFRLDDTININNQNKHAITLWGSNTDSLIIISKKTLSWSKQLKYIIGQIDAESNLGLGYYEKGEYLKSINHYQESIKLANKYADVGKEAKSMCNISKPMIALGAHNEALNYLYKTLAIAEKFNIKDTKANILHNIGMVYHYQDRDKEAIEYYKRSRSAFEAIGDSTKTTFILGNIAHLFVKKKHYKEAEIYYNLSLKLARNYKNNKAIANALTSLGSLKSALNQEDSAITYYLQAKKIFEELGEKTEYTRILDNLGESYHKQKKFTKALHYAHLNYELACKQQQLYYISTSSALLSLLYEKMNKPQLALDYYKKFSYAQDSLYSSSNKEELVRLKEKYTLEKRQQHLDEAYQRSLNNKEMYIKIAYLTILFLIIIAILLLFYIKQKKKANRMLLNAKRIIEHENKSLIKANDFKKQLLSLLAHDIRTPIANVKMILMLLNKSDLQERRINKMIQSSQREIEGLMLFVDNLLLWITLKLNDKKIIKKYFSLEEVIAETLSLHRIQAKNKGIKLTMQINKDLEVFADAEALKIVIRNLINNAIKFCSAGDLVNVNSDWNENTEQALIRITDNGTGISENDLKQILNNVANSQEGTAQEKGIGIGLQLCIQYLTLNDSKLYVKSSRQNGTEFCFNLKGRKSIDSHV